MEHSDSLESGTDRLLDHIESPFHKGRLENATCAYTERNPLCGDQIELQILIEYDRVGQAWFDGRGCAISQAAASMLCEFVEGRTVANVETLSAEEVLALLGVPISLLRRRCALLGFQALRKLLATTEHK